MGPDRTYCVFNVQSKADALASLVYLTEWTDKN